jgi:hypothetical protein
MKHKVLQQWAECINWLPDIPSRWQSPPEKFGGNKKFAEPQTGGERRVHFQFYIVLRQWPFFDQM